MIKTALQIVLVFIVGIWIALLACTAIYMMGDTPRSSPEDNGISGSLTGICWSFQKVNGTCPRLKKHHQRKSNGNH